MALRMDPTNWSDPEALYRRAKDYFVGVSQLQGSSAVSATGAFVRGFMHHLPTTLTLPAHFGNRLQADLLAEFGYQTYVSGDRTTARRYMVQALIADPRRQCRWGLIKRMLQTIAPFSHLLP